MMTKIAKNLRQLLPLLFVSLFLAQCSKDEGEKFPYSIDSIDPLSGSVGTTVTIKGKGFKATNTVTFAGVEAAIQSVTATEIVTQVPANATTGPVIIHDGTLASQSNPVFTVTEPQVTKTYYIKFKANGVLKIFEEGNPGYQMCGNCACSYIPVLNDTRNASIDMCQMDNDWVTAGDILSWNNKKVLFNTNNVFPVASFSYKENNVYFDTSAPNQTGSEVNITSTVSDGSYLGAPAYKVTGTFKCKVAKSDGSSVTDITEGQFVIRYTQDL